MTWTLGLNPINASSCFSPERWDDSELLTLFLLTWIWFTSIHSHNCLTSSFILIFLWFLLLDVRCSREFVFLWEGAHIVHGRGGNNAALCSLQDFEETRSQPASWSLASTPWAKHERSLLVWLLTRRKLQINRLSAKNNLNYNIKCWMTSSQDINTLGF